MAKINTFQFSAKEGFLLLDSMVSIVLISISMLIVGRYTFSIIEYNHDTQLTLRALNVATGLLDQSIRNKQLPETMRQQLDLFTIAWHVERREPPSLPKIQKILSNTTPSFTTVAITISFKALRGQVRSYTFVGGFALMQETA